MDKYLNSLALINDIAIGFEEDGPYGEDADKRALEAMRKIEELSEEGACAFGRNEEKARLYSRIEERVEVLEALQENHAIPERQAIIDLCRSALLLLKPDERE